MRPLMLPVQPAKRVRLTIPRLKRLVRFQGSLRIVEVVPSVTLHQADRSRKNVKKCGQPKAIPALRITFRDYGN
jgi:hypothetical protein